MFAKLVGACAAMCLGASAHAADFQYTSGSGQRSLGILNSVSAGQTFTATAETLLQSFGFQIQTLNAGSANNAITFSLLSGAGLGGSVLATRSLTPVGVPTTRTPTWIDFDLTGVTLTEGAAYTALLSTTSSRYALVYGPDINLSTGNPTGPESYLGGRLIATSMSSPNRACDSGVCDANFRFSAVAPVTPAVPEPATWAMMIAGFGLTGMTMRRRRVVRAVSLV